MEIKYYFDKLLGVHPCESVLLITLIILPRKDESVNVQYRQIFNQIFIAIARFSPKITQMEKD